jgi:hypothetical protein
MEIVKQLTTKSMRERRAADPEIARTRQDLVGAVGPDDLEWTIFGGHGTQVACNGCILGFFCRVSDLGTNAGR